jgi:hypothetical protein
MQLSSANLSFIMTVACEQFEMTQFHLNIHGGGISEMMHRGPLACQNFERDEIGREKYVFNDIRRVFHQTLVAQYRDVLARLPHEVTRKSLLSMLGKSLVVV